MNGQIIEFPDIEAMVIGVLEADLETSRPGVHASGRVPTPRPKSFVRVMRTGGPKETLISENAMIVVEAWAQSEIDASSILGRCRAVLNSQDGALFGVTEVGGPINLPDPITYQVRYTQLFGVRTRGAVSA